MDPIDHARAFLAQLLDGTAPTELPADLGDFHEASKSLYEAYELGKAEAVNAAFEVLARDDPRLELLRPASMRQSTPRKKPAPLTAYVPPLDKAAHLPEGIERDACPWLDRYIQFSKYWSPSGYPGFHEAIGLWVLSTIAARRICLPLGAKMQYTPLYIALTARSGIYAKSETASVGVRVVRDAGLGYLLAGDNYTPQSFIKSMTGVVPADYERASDKTRAWIDLSVAFSAQRGWFFDEFSQLIDGMRKKSGHMGEFSGILRRIYDCQDSYTSSTIERGEEKVADPYLAMLVNMTPADLRSSGKRGSDLWGNGFFGRMAFIGPDKQGVLKGRMPNERFNIPADILMPLHHWHERLGIPAVSIEQDRDVPSKYYVERGNFPENEVVFDKGVFDAFYAYRDALSDLVDTSDEMDLDSNYARFAAKSLRIAMLVASLENNGIISMPIWALAQSITERWRANLHAIFAQINEASPSFGESLENRVIGIVERWHEREGKLPTMRNIRQNISGVPSKDLTQMIESMVRTGLLAEYVSGKTKYYGLPVEEGRESEEKQG